MEQKEIEKLIPETKEKTILVIKTKITPKIVDDGIELNDGYNFEVNGALPEIADGIAKMAKELPANGFGEGSDKYFITLIQQYFDKVKGE